MFKNNNKMFVETLSKKSNEKNADMNYRVLNHSDDVFDDIFQETQRISSKKIMTDSIKKSEQPRDNQKVSKKSNLKKKRQQKFEPEILNSMTKEELINLIQNSRFYPNGGMALSKPMEYKPENSTDMYDDSSDDSGDDSGDDNIITNNKYDDDDDGSFLYTDKNNDRQDKNKTKNVSQPKSDINDLNMNKLSVNNLPFSNTISPINGTSPYSRKLNPTPKSNNNYDGDNDDNDDDDDGGEDSDSDYDSDSENGVDKKNEDNYLFDSSKSDKNLFNNNLSNDLFSQKSDDKFSFLGSQDNGMSPSQSSAFPKRNYNDTPKGSTSKLMEELFDVTPDNSRTPEPLRSDDSNHSSVWRFLSDPPQKKFKHKWDSNKNSPVNLPVVKPSKSDKNVMNLTPDSSRRSQKSPIDAFRQSPILNYPSPDVPDLTPVDDTVNDTVDLNDYDLMDEDLSDNELDKRIKKLTKEIKEYDHDNQSLLQGMMWTLENYKKIKNSRQN